jgi:hypothetical protein
VDRYPYYGVEHAIRRKELDMITAAVTGMSRIVGFVGVLPA